MMISQLNPIDIITGHLKTIGPQHPTEISKISFWRSLSFLSTGLPLAIWQLILLIDGKFLQADIIGVIVSAASIIAGLLLNLLVLIYTVVINQELRLKDSWPLFKKIALHTFYNISFTIFTSLLLVIFSLCSLADNINIQRIGNVMTFYIGTICILSLLMVLRKCHKLIAFQLEK